MEIKGLEDEWNHWLNYEKKVKRNIHDKTNDEGMIKRIQIN